MDVHISLIALTIQVLTKLDSQSPKRSISHTLNNPVHTYTVPKTIILVHNTKGHNNNNGGD